MTLALIATLPFLGAVLPALMIRTGRNSAAAAAFCVTATALVLLGVEAPAVFRGEVVTQSVDWLPALGLRASFMLDGLGLLFAGMILGIGLLIIVYARFYLDKNDPMGRFYSFLLMFQGAMVGIVLSDNILLLLIFWELTSLSSFLLIGYWRHLPEGRQGARMALAVTGGGGLAMIGGMLILGDIAGSYELSAILQSGEAIRAHPMYLPALILILLGCFTKSAQFPFHFWLPHAMAAPTPVSAYLHSATMVKAGIFLMARLWPALAGTEAWFLLVATTGLVTMVAAAIIALFKDDLKGLLAFSTVSHLGLVTMLFGFGTPAAAIAGVFHIVNHATFKAALFMCAGIVDHEAKTRDVKRLGGLALLMPVTATLAIVAGASMAGLFPLNGFISKEMMLERTLRATLFGSDWIVPVLASVGALFSVAYSFRWIFHVFLGKKRHDYPAKPHDPPFGMWVSPAILVALVVLIGLLPDTLAGPIVRAASGAVIGGPAPDYVLKLWHGWNLPLAISMAATVVGALMIWGYPAVRRAWDGIGLVHAKSLFDAGMDWAEGATTWLTEAIHDGSLRRALALFVGTVLVVGVWAFVTGESAGLAPAGTPAPPVTVAVALLLALATVGAVAFHRQRFFAVILVSVVGFVNVLAFIYLSAPDLALTQVSVEVATLILMLLALNFLPKETPAESTILRRTRDGALAIAAGLGAAGLTYALLGRSMDPISAYHLANSYVGGGGTNVVNVILVDFRGFDTYGEIIVLGIAALAIYALLDGAMRGPAHRRVTTWIPDQARSQDRHPLMPAVVARAILPFALLVGVYIFLRGHNEPGGGFIAGLVVSIALLIQYMGSGYAWTADRMKLDYHSMIGAGVVIAGLAGVGAWLNDKPFLTSAFGYVSLPGLNKFELATAMIFDLGVFLTVVGTVMLALANLSRLARPTEAAPSEEPMDFDPSKRLETAGEGR